MVSLHPVHPRTLRHGFAIAGVIAASLASSSARADAPDDLALIPVDSEMIGGVDFQQLQASALWAKYVGPLMAKADVQKSLGEFQAECGVDPLKVVTKLTFGMKGLGAPQPDLVLVAHGVPKAKLVACFDKMLAKQKTKKDVTITRDGDLVLVKRDNGSTAFSFLDDSTALFVVGAPATSDGIATIKKGGSALKTSAAFTDLYKRTNTADTLWVIMNGSSKVFDGLAKLGIKPKAVYGSLAVGNDLGADVKVRMRDAAGAQSLAKAFNDQLGANAAMFDKIAIVADGSDVKLTAQMSDAKLRALVQQLGGTGSTSEPPAPAKRAPAPAKSKPAPGGCDEVGCVLNNYDSACCAKFKKRGT